MLRLGKNQKSFLSRVVRSNGGGVYARPFEYKTMRSLEAKGLVQGMSGKPWRAVHTEDGLNFYREHLQVEAQ